MPRRLRRVRRPLIALVALVAALAIGYGIRAARSSGTPAGVVHVLPVDGRR